MAYLLRNAWPTCCGTHGLPTAERMAYLLRNAWPPCCGTHGLPMAPSERTICNWAWHPVNDTLHLGLAPSERIATPWLLHTSKAPCARYLQMYYQTPHGFIIGPCFATFLMFHFSNAM